HVETTTWRHVGTTRSHWPKTIGSLILASATYRDRGAMIVKAGHIRNPLTVIGLFCILLEVALTAGMAAVPEVYFLIYLIFFMVLTVGVISTFFGILLLKPTALYGPSDYENPEDFFKALQMSSKNVVESVVELKQTLAMRDSELNAKISALEGVS
ncbi:MAG: hypothetical protein RLO18_13905, partial [Gimesia chilikensis]